MSDQVPAESNGCEQTAARVKRYRDSPMTLGNAARSTSRRKLRRTGSRRSKPNAP